MHAKLAYPILWALVLLTCWGCATVPPQKKPTVNAPKILEEDIAERRSTGPSEQPGQPGGPAETAPPGVGIGGQAPPTLDNQQAGASDPGRRPKARYNWEDKGSGRGWKRVPERTEVP